MTSAAVAFNHNNYPFSNIHRVEQGESLYLIAQRHGTTLSRIRRLNRNIGDTIYPGQHLIVYRSFFDTGLNHIPYKVREGDTVGRIAENFGVSISTISAMNPDINLDVIYPGQKINILADFKEHRVMPGDTLFMLSQTYGATEELIQQFSGISTHYLKVGQFLNVPMHEQRNIVRPHIPWTVDISVYEPTVTQTTYNVRAGDTAWNIAIRFGVPLRELLYVNNMNADGRITVGQTLLVPVHHIPKQQTPGSQFGEYLDWWTEAQYVLPINQIAMVIDHHTETAFRIRRTMGENHADAEPMTAYDTEIARGIWGEYSWAPRPVIVEVDGRRIAASMSFFPHGVQYIVGNDFDGHFDIHFRNSSWHSDGRVDEAHQENVRIAAGR